MDTPNATHAVLSFYEKQRTLTAHPLWARTKAYDTKDFVATALES